MLSDKDFARAIARIKELGWYAKIQPEKDGIISSVESVTKDWAKQRKTEERDRSRVFRRYDYLVRDDRVTIRDAAWEVMDAAYAKASDNGRLPVRPRQIMYAARPRS